MVFSRQFPLHGPAHQMAENGQFIIDASGSPGLSRLGGGGFGPGAPNLQIHVADLGQLPLPELLSKVPKQSYENYYRSCPTFRIVWFTRCPLGMPYENMEMPLQGV